MKKITNAYSVLMYNVIFVNILFISKINEKKLEFVGKKLEKKPDGKVQKAEREIYATECWNARMPEHAVFFLLYFNTYIGLKIE